MSVGSGCCQSKAPLREDGDALQMTYTTFITGLKEENVQLNRKVLSELAMNEPYSFKALVDQVRFMRGIRNAPSQQQQLG